MSEEKAYASPLPLQQSQTHLVGIQLVSLRYIGNHAILKSSIQIFTERELSLFEGNTLIGCLNLWNIDQKAKTNRGICQVLGVGVNSGKREAGVKVTK